MRQQVSEFMCATGSPPIYIQEFSELQELKQRMIDRLRWHKEELQELEDALHLEDWVEVADAVGDMKYFQLQDQIDLEAAGFDMMKVGELICENNGTKYSASVDYMCQQLGALKNDNYYVESNICESTIYYCIKDKTTGKVKKPFDFEPVELKSCLPKYLTNTGILHDCKLPTGDWRKDILTKIEYDELIATGLGWEVYKDLPFSWAECLQSRDQEE